VAPAQMIPLAVMPMQTAPASRCWSTANGSMRRLAGAPKAEIR